MKHEAAPLDALRARREALRRSLAEAITERAEAQASLADVVAAAGSPPADWPIRSAKLDADVHSLTLGVNRLEGDVRVELARVKLAVAKLEQGRRSLMSTRDQLYFERSELIAGAVRSATKQAPMPSAFALSLTDLETRLADTVARLEALDGEIAVADAPALRYEREQILAGERTDSALANAA